MRAKALKWWRGLTHIEQRDFAEKHFPEHTFLEVTTSSSKIEQIFKNEQ